MDDLYLHCTDCGEAFDTLKTANNHPCDSQGFDDGPHYYISEEL